ncbi:MAG TPA: hypothetical protein VNB49_08925 [Candidatus Dormibacteraeota bacterium]|nr:hypothetical protein [Candidatus Dormibacteraeota bacterium]
MRAAIFHAAALEVICSFSEDACRKLGKAIFNLQRGEALDLLLALPMPSIAPVLRFRMAAKDVSTDLLLPVLYSLGYTAKINFQRAA